MKKVQLSLRAKLIGLVLSVVILLGIGTVFNLNRFESDYKERIKTQMVFAAIKLGKSITAQLYERYGDAQAFAVNRSIISMNKELMQEDLDRYVKLYSIYDLILVLDKNGNLIAANSKNSNGEKVNFEKIKAINFAKTDWFQKALHGEFTEDKETGYSGTYVEDYILNSVVGEAFGEAKYGSIFSTQIKDSKGEVIGVFANHAGARWIENEINEYHSQMIEEELLESEVMVFNAEGKVISHSDVSETTKKATFETNQDVILKQGLDDFHPGLSAIVDQDISGFKEMIHEQKGLMDLVAFHSVKNLKSISSLDWKVVVEDTAEDAYHKTRSAKIQAYLILAVVSFFGILLAVWAGIIISKSIAQVTSTLAVNSEEVADASLKIASSSTQLSETATEQAAALQETVAAVDEISAMVDRNAESAQKSRDVSQQSREAANRGRETVSNMILAIQEIDQSNDEINQQMDESNRQLEEITKLINDISNKTTVINEIVFQTKLLSFNASVEAARAGEAGKGFAVVAEEVGNLAQMSGNAAKEISSLLDESVQKVNTIVSTSKSKIDHLMLTSKDKVKKGSATAQDCNESLDEIISQIQTVDSLVSEIAVASQEQSTGIREVSRAMAQMEQATQQNSTVANATSSAGEQIRGQSEILSSLVKDLSYIVTGKTNANIESRSGIKKSSPAPSKSNHRPAVKSESSGPEKNQKQESPKKKTPVLKLVSDQKSKKADSLLEKPTKKLDSSPAVAQEEFKPSKKNQLENVPMASGADFVPSGDDPGFSE